ncbi:hypothetical protein CHU95_03785 [Niveispirillum lacus]|uniref:DUF3320 domain-containing protein n=1 Tax=Niveispirillum lacus TaxID=1981099 RepID=A0A255Z589_9PROT|nr:DUF3320 domain-containing protein [Niveispirillum lacus]OYQ36693.1 hypothetical protein CHU95_03785 [Niveispirillum lacus]
MARSLKTALEAALRPEAPPAPPVSLADLPADPVDPQEENAGAPPVPEMELLVGDYRITDFSDQPSIAPERFQDPDYAAVLRDMILRVVECEAPIRETLLLERMIARAHGFKRSGRQVRDRLLSVARGVAHLETETSGSGFIWANATAPAAWERARYPCSDEDIRMVEDIALPELAAAIRAGSMRRMR